MGWSTRVLLRRGATQRTILATVLAVAVVSSGLLGTFSLLLTSSADRAIDVTLARAPGTDTDLEADLTIGSRPPGAALDAAQGALGALSAGIAATRDEWIDSPPYQLPRAGDRTVPLGIVASYPDIGAHTALSAGTWPSAATDSAGRVEIAVPGVAAEHFAWTVGSELPLASTASSATITAIVVGIYDTVGARSYWAHDVLKGEGVDHGFPVPGTMGMSVTSAYGPLITTTDALLGGSVEVASGQVVLHPQLDAADPGALAVVRGRLDTASPDIDAAVKPHVTSVTFVSRLATSLDSARGQLAVTRVGLVVIALMLAVLALTVLLLAARLLAERRSGEQNLMASRGASGGQLLRLAALEALVIAGVTTATAPLLARGLFRLLTAQHVFRAAGLDQDPGLPGALWATCAAAALAFAGVLLVPLLRRPTSVVDAQQQQVRQDRRGALTRSGIDIALVALAGVGYWQLRTYHSPVLGPDGIDPVLATGPALFLLAGAAIALRGVPLVAAAAERLAARSRSLVLPLAAWEVGRRPARATGTILLLTLAVAVGTFSQSFLTTWRASQVDQADLQVGTDVRVDPLATPPLEQSGTVGTLPGALAISPVTSQTVDLGPATLPGTLPGPTQQVQLLALDTTRPDALLRGRAPVGTDWAATLAPIAPSAPIAGTPLPGTPDALRLDVTVTPADATSTMRVLPSVVVQDAHGLRVTLPMPNVPSDGVQHQVVVPLTSSASAPLAAPLTVIGLVARLDAPGARAGRAVAGAPATVGYTLTVGDLWAVDGEVITSADLTTASWSATAFASRGRRPATNPSVTSDARSLTVRGDAASQALDAGTAGFTVTSFDPAPTMPALATDQLLQTLGVQVGDTIVMGVGGTTASAVIVGVVPYLPSMPSGEGLLVDRDLLTRALVTAGSVDPVLDQWWIEVPDAQAPALTTAARELASAVSRTELRAELADGPLRIGVQSALWITTAASLILAVAGFAMSATVSVRLRELEFARLQALGASRSGLVRAVVAEHTLLGLLGLGAGLGLGALLGRLVAPLLTVGADGNAPRPSVVVHWPWISEGSLLATTFVLLTVTVVLTAALRLRRASSALLRLGDDR